MARRSALSPVEVDPMATYAVDTQQEREGYSDVGFRLAFSAPDKSGGEKPPDPSDSRARLSGPLNFSFETVPRNYYPAIDIITPEACRSPRKPIGQFLSLLT